VPRNLCGAKWPLDVCLVDTSGIANALITSPARDCATRLHRTYSPHISSLYVRHVSKILGEVKKSPQRVYGAIRTQTKYLNPSVIIPPNCSRYSSQAHEVRCEHHNEIARVARSEPASFFRQKSMVRRRPSSRLILNCHPSTDFALEASP
jgi:hypothetical protein